MNPRSLLQYLVIASVAMSIHNGNGQTSESNPSRVQPIIVPNEREMVAKEQLLGKISSETTGNQLRPNIVLILADDLGYADTGIYGSKSIPTPHLDALAKGGVRFTDAYVTAATCSPSRAGLMTGRYQQRYGFEFNTSGAAITHRESRGLDPAAVTLADVLQKAGYATGMFGKWHLGTREYFHPQARGFDDFFGFLAGAHSYFPAQNDQPVYSTILRGKQPLNEPEYLTDAFAREAVRFIEEHKDEPFFVYVPFNAVHTPIEATERYLNRFPDEPDKTQRAYNAMTSALDDAVGSIVKALKKNHIDRNTLVIFLNDNGGPIYTRVQNNGPLRLGKLFLFEGGVRVPMILNWPGVLNAGMIYQELTSSLDVFPTACAAAGIELPAELNLDGVNLLPHLQGEKTTPPHQTLFWSNGPNKAIRFDRWKMVKSGDHVWLFDLAKDIGETKNLANDRPDMVEELQSKLIKWLNEMKPPAWPSKPNRRIINIDGVGYQLNI